VVGVATVQAPAAEWQASLFGVGEPGFDPDLSGASRLWLDATSWVDHLPRWLRGADAVFDDLVSSVRWRQRTVPMYDRLVREPRLTWWWAEGDEAPPPPFAVLQEARHALGRWYGKRFDSIGCNYYRNGADSVAWHGDRIRFYLEDPVVATVSVGSPRPFLLRPRGGGRSRSFLLGHGDLFVMGGACQHDWEHTVPKVASAGPRISITFRHDTAAPEDIVTADEAMSVAEEALLTGRANHPSGRAQNRHTVATAPRHGAGTLEVGGAEQRGVRSRMAGPETEGRAT
jgi:alkylated DNA repair dioxygenase AlkB